MCVAVVTAVLDAITSTLELNMELVIFPKQKPSKRRLADIYQIEYTIWKQHKDDPNLLALRAYNNQRPITSEDTHDPNPYPWRLIPVDYAYAMSIAFCRFEMLKIASQDTEIYGGNGEHIKTATINLHYLDMVLDEFWVDAKAAVEEDKMDSNWRSDHIDRWLRAEFYIHKHSPDAIADWEANNTGIEWTNTPIDALGTNPHAIHD
jgi:hypothetical protein